MNPPLEAPAPDFNIGAVERETGLSKDLLRMWERRYGYPRPARDDAGERLYSAADVSRLRTIKRLMDAGLRPGKIVHRSLEELEALANARNVGSGSDAVPAFVREVFELMRAHDTTGLTRVLVERVAHQGLQRFVLETIAPLNRAVGAAWASGDLHVFEEHRYTETVQGALRSEISALPHPAEASPRVLLTTFPKEIHHLGLLMVEALLAPEGAQCISLGTQTPVEDVRRAALAHRANIVALSFSGAHPLRHAVEGLETLRARLPSQATIWAGGELTRRVRRTIPGIVLIPDLAAVIPALRSWRALRGPQAAG